jgi:hypothetical protein
MHMTTTITWEKVREFELDDPESALTFTQRLARENGWTLEFSIRAVHEYKKFIYLNCISSHPLTPSDEVDQVWHLHLLYTESYWIDLCQNLLQKTIHHGPTKGGKQETEKFNTYYEKTLLLYKSTFGMDPPADVWPKPQVRFAPTKYQRINLRDYWMIKKPKNKLK